jgi:hypothetical protein
VRIIHTDSPQISCLALSALYLVHGGNDGLVQAWDLLASNMQPIRTLNSRFSSRARRHLAQAETSPRGVGVNLFAAGAVCLDPDPTVLRGMVSIGTHLRYWSYSSTAADQYKSNKRRVRRSERGSNQTGNKYVHTGRGALKDYIENEQLEHERDKRNRRKEEERLSGRFGLDLLGPSATEDEIMAYATMLSEESLKSDEARGSSGGSSDGSSGAVTDTVSLPLQVTHGEIVNQEDDPDIAEAIRLSLQDHNLENPDLPNSSSSSVCASTSGYWASSPPAEYPIRYIKPKGRSSTPSSPPAGASWTGAIATDHGATSSAKDDLDFALQLSAAEEASRREVGEVDEFPALREQVK